MEVRFIPTSRGFERIEVKHSCREQRPPKHILDKIVEDAIMQRQREGRCEQRMVRPVIATRTVRVMPQPQPQARQGIVANIPMPQIEDYYSMSTYMSDMRKYERATQAIEACDWDSRSQKISRALEELINLL